MVSTSPSAAALPLIAHIDEGLIVLQRLGASLAAMRAFCIHPLLQADQDLHASLRPDSILLQSSPEPVVLILALEYRASANAYLAKHYSGATLNESGRP